jgi:8-amino-7-oxononanoate synthase
MDLFEKCRTTRVGDEIRATGAYPFFRVMETGQDAEVTVEGRRMIMMGSNNYLGLASHPRIKLASVEAVMRFGTGSAGSRCLNGTNDLHRALEERLARFFRREAALAFTSGYQANLGVISALAGRGDVVVVDKLAHASIFDACRLSQAEVKRFRHNDARSLDAVLRAAGDRGKLVAIDGVYSMHGDIAALPEIVEVCRRHGARLMMDDAHGLGVLGRTGRGTAEHFGLEDEVDILVGTTSKAIPSVGGFAIASAEVVEFMKHGSRPLIFATSAPPAAVATVIAALGVIEDEPALRERLWSNTRKLQRGLRAMGFDLGKSETPIVPVMTGDLGPAQVMFQSLCDAGVFVNPVMPPAVHPTACIMRTTVMATHTEAQLDHVLDAFQRAGERAGVIAPALRKAG